ncbi:hypothetical protein HYU13_00070 [Candidatus Woesearchaeota archaeon]|nr:hypothetical protein [Candidatus Woesearchaeota archaeon]
MAYLGYCVGTVAPYYNLALVLIVVLLFFRLFRMENKGAFIKPWKILFLGVLIYIVEEVITVLESLGVVVVSQVIFPVFEMAIISLFIFMLLLQKDYVKP